MCISRSAADYDSHEMNKFEFLKAMELIAKRIGAISQKSASY